MRTGTVPVRCVIDSVKTGGYLCAAPGSSFCEKKTYIIPQLSLASFGYILYVDMYVHMYVDVSDSALDASGVLALLWNGFWSIIEKLRN